MSVLKIAILTYDKYEKDKSEKIFLTRKLLKGENQKNVDAGKNNLKHGNPDNDESVKGHS